MVLVQRFQEQIKEFQVFSQKVAKVAKLFSSPPYVKVGTAPKEVVYEDGKVRLLHYKPTANEPYPVPLLIVYALINKPYILDLQPERSVIRHLLNEGFDVYLIDWGTPTDSDKYLTMDDYVNWYISDMVDYIRAKHDIDSISLMGYCMGGVLSAMYTALHPQKVRNFITMAAGLDLGDDPGLLKQWARKEFFDVDKLVDTVGNVPADFINFGYQLLDPVGNMYSKYAGFADKVDNEKFVKMFFRMEKWVSDGIPVAGEVYREYIKELYQNNKLIRNELRLGGKKVDLGNITMPVLSIIGQYDHLVPPQTSRTFNDHISSKDKDRIIFPTGHIGLSVSSATHAKMWPQVTNWLKERSKDEHVQKATVKPTEHKVVKKRSKPKAAKKASKTKTIKTTAKSKTTQNTSKPKPVKKASKPKKKAIRK